VETLGGYIATIIVSLLIGYFSQFLKPRSKLQCWSPHNFIFNLQNENVVLQSNSLTIQNVGREPAEDVEIIHKKRPDFFELFPSVEFQETTNSNGEHVIKLKTLGPKEWVMVQLLSYKNLPVLANVRWRHGQAKPVQIQPQRVWPRWWNNVLTTVLLIGAGTIVYWIIRVAVYLAGQFGHVSL